MKINGLVVAAIATVVGVVTGAADTTLTLNNPGGGGTVTGGGVYPAGQKVSLKATPGNGYVFAGWFDGDKPLEGKVDYRQKNFAYIVPEKDVSITPKFVTFAQDAKSFGIDLTDVTLNASGPLNYSLRDNFTSLSAPNVRISGLPRGVKFDSKALVLKGTPKKPGLYHAKAMVKSESVKKMQVKEFDVHVPNINSGLYTGKYSDYLDHSLTAPRYQLCAGTLVSFTPNAKALPAGWSIVSVKGLPSGLKFNAGTGLITGTVKKSGSYMASIVTSSNGRTYLDSITITVSPLASWAVGTFEGAVEKCLGHNGNIKATVTDKGVLSGKISLIDGNTISFRSKNITHCEDAHTVSKYSVVKWQNLELRTPKGPVKASFEIRPVRYTSGGRILGRLSFFVENKEYTFLQNPWTAKPAYDWLPKIKGSPAFVRAVLANGTSADLFFQNKGGIKIKGMTDGFVSWTVSANMFYYGQGENDDTILGLSVCAPDGNFYRLKFLMTGTGTGIYSGLVGVGEMQEEPDVHAITDADLNPDDDSKGDSGSDADKPNGYSVIFNANDGTGLTVSQDFEFDKSTELKPNEFLRAGYNFLGWAKSSNGEVAYVDREVVLDLTTARDGKVVLYAVWAPIHYFVSFDANCSDFVGTIDSQEIAYDESAKLNANAFKRIGYKFLGWSLTVDGGVAYTDGASVRNLSQTDDETVKLYAVWGISSYTISYDGNGASGVMASQKTAYNETVALSANAFTLDDAEFAGWSKTPDGDVEFADGASVSKLCEADGETITLYAVWYLKKFSIAGLDFETSGTGSGAGNKGWAPFNRSVFADRVRSGEIGDGESSEISAKVTGPCKVSFRWETSSEEGADFLTFAVDGNPVGSISGDKQENVSFCIEEAGEHELKWTYSKNASGSAGLDCAYLDNFVIGEIEESDYRYVVIDLSEGSSATEYPVSKLVYEPVGGWTDEYKTTKLVLRKISAGSFLMGSPVEEAGREANYTDETQHAVTLSTDYLMGVFEVTQKQWDMVMGTVTGDPYNPNPALYEGEMRPVETVAYGDVQLFVTALSAKVSEYGFNLPTEAQWEYACRAGSEAAFEQDAATAETGHFGSVADDGFGGYGQHTTVGLYLPNAWGIYDMHGNVAEWCLDWYDAYGTDAVTDPVGPASGTEYVIRGGYWGSRADNSRSAFRDKRSAQDKEIGFRLSAAPVTP